MASSEAVDEGGLALVVKGFGDLDIFRDDAAGGDTDPGDELTRRAGSGASACPAAPATNPLASLPAISSSSRPNEGGLALVVEEIHLRILIFHSEMAPMVRGAGRDRGLLHLLLVQCDSARRAGAQDLAHRHGRRAIARKRPILGELSGDQRVEVGRGRPTMSSKKSTSASSYSDGGAEPMVVEFVGSAPGSGFSPSPDGTAPAPAARAERDRERSRVCGMGGGP